MKRGKKLVPLLYDISTTDFGKIDYNIYKGRG